MYSRYSGISIPKNYGGSRFQPEREPEVKAHRPPSLSASRVAHSPSFVPIESRVNEGYEENSVVEESFTSEDSISSEKICEEGDIAEDEGYDEVGDDEADAEANEEVPALARGKELSSLKSIISRFDKDTLLLLGLILLLMSDDKENDDIIALLALVLLG